MKTSHHRRGIVLWSVSMGISLVLIGTWGQLFFPILVFEAMAALGVAMGLAVFAGKVDLPGALVGGLIGISIFLSGGFTALLMLMALFVLGTAASHWRKEDKAQLG